MPRARVWSLQLMGSFELRDGERAVPLPYAARRLVAFLALHDRPVARHRTAGMLWPDVSEARSMGSLRSALWRLRQLAPDVVVATPDDLTLATGVALDVRAHVDEARRVIDGNAAGMPIDAGRFGLVLLPGWYDDWVVFERERTRILSLTALESASRMHTRAGCHQRAVDLALMSVCLDPLRESAHAALIDAHIAEGNLCEAIRRLRSCEQVLGTEFGVGPQPELVARVSDATAARRRALSVA